MSYRARLAAPLTILIGAAACSGPARPAAPGPTTTPAPAPAPPEEPGLVQLPLTAPTGVRLPRPITFTRAALDLDLDPSRDSFTGHARLDGVMAQAESVIWLHAEKLTITRAAAVRTIVKSGARDEPIALEVVTGLARGRIALRSPTRLIAGEAYTLELDYTAPIDSVETAGTFRQRLDGRWYLYTQHEPIAARRSFPCLDEPDLKIPWTLTVTIPDGLVAVANAPEVSSTVTAAGRRTIAFAPTEPLPSYLVAYAVGPFEIVPAGTTAGGAPIRIITPAGKAAEAWFAAEATPKLLAALERWFGTPYPFAKLDSIAIPTTVGFGAMENPGLITYTERALLMPRDAPEVRKRRYVGIGTHEMAHQWFGDLVTPVWWDDIWLNESFASWLPGKVIGDVYPAYRRIEDDALGRGGSLASDSLASARRIRQPIATEDDIVTAFDGITYGKGASLLRMMEAWTSPEAFQRGVRKYLADHARGNATATDFVRAIAEATGTPDIESAFASFLDQAGAPRLEAAIDCAGERPFVRLTQRRYLPLGVPVVDGAPSWTLPVCVVAGGARVERVCGVMTAPELRLELAGCPRWVWPNADARGYFRSAMSVAAWKALKAGGWKALKRPERIAAAQDLWAAVAAGDVDLDLALDWVPALLDEKTAPAIQLAAEALAGLRPLVTGTARTKLATWVDRRLGKRARALGWLRRPRDTVDVEDLRTTLVGLVAILGDRDLGQAAVTLAADWRTLPEAPRRAVLQAAVRADPSIHGRLLADLRGETDHARAADLAAALGVVRDPARLRTALELLVDKSLDIRDVINLLWAAIGEDETRAVAEQFVVDRTDDILVRMPDEWGASLVGALTASCDADRAVAMRAVAEAKLAQRRGARRRIDQAFERLDQCVAQRAAVRPALARWLAQPRR